MFLINLFEYGCPEREERTSVAKRHDPGGWEKTRTQHMRHGRQRAVERINQSCVAVGPCSAISKEQIFD